MEGKSLLENQKLIKQELDRLLSNFKKDTKERKSSEDYFKRKLSTLESYWVDYQDNHSKLYQFALEDDPYFINKEYTRAQQSYQAAKSYISNEYEEYIAKQGKFHDDDDTGDKAERQKTLPPGSGQTPRGELPLQHEQQTARGQESRTDELMRKQSSNFKAFLRTISNIDVTTIKEKWEFEDVLKSLETRWAAIDSLHWEIDSILNEENEDYEETYSRNEHKYQTIKKLINQKLWAVSNMEKATPRMTIPEFNGNYHKWVSFKDLFVEAIHNNASMSNAQKMQFLKSKLRGEAEHIIQHLKITSDNYESCWKILSDRFDNTKLIVYSHLDILFNLPTMKQQSAYQIKRLHDVTNECLFAIKNLGANISTWDPLIIYILQQKLDSVTNDDYIKTLRNPKALPVLSDFMDFLKTKFTSLESARYKQDKHQQEPTSSSSSSKKYHNQEKSNFRQNDENQTRKFFNHSTQKSFYTGKGAGVEKRCSYCNNTDHAIYFCKKFLDLSTEIKKRSINNLNLCKNCLYNHNGKSCFSEKRCKECNGNHNTLLHEAFTSECKPKPEHMSKPRENVSRNNSHVSQENISEVLLATAIIKVQAKNGNYYNFKALCDQGSQISIISQNAAQLLQLPRQRCKGVIYGVGSKENSCKGTININCSSLTTDYMFNVDVYIMRNIINNLPNQSFPEPSWSYLKNIKLADPKFYESRPVDILLGADVYSSILMDGIIKKDNSLPIAQQTQLGWILSGNIKSFHCNVILNSIEDFQRFWTVEDIGEKSELSTEDQECVEFYQKTTTRLDNGHYQVRLPLISDGLDKLGESKQKAVAQFKQIENKLKRRNQLAEQYKLFMKEYQDLGHMKPAARDSRSGCYLPHHAVERADSATTKVRIVYNASMLTSSNFSLNSVMKQGPNLQQDLFELILKWRQYEVAFTADIEKMFRQIYLHEEDQDLHKIIWRESINQPLKEYQLTTVTYGTKAAPFLAMMTLKQLARDEGSKYQSAAKDVLENNFYMDDLVSGHFDTNSAKRLISDLIRLLRSGGFNLRKWASNKPEIFGNSQDEQQPFEFKPSESSKTLGLRWNPKSDEFLFQISMSDLSEKTTKRALLSNISKLFDPLGWLAPLTTKLKILFQKVWQTGIQWDEQVPDDIRAEWINIRNDLQNIDQIKIPRWLKIRKNNIIELHGFSDSSTKAFACVIFCKVIKEPSSKITVVPVAAKARIVSEHKNMSIPRLELCGAHLLSKLIKKVINCLPEHTIKIFGWIDSTAVLGWIQGEPSRWKPFVSNRVQQITEIMPPECWRYVNSSDNPADCASRGLSADQLKNHSLWWQGPVWLSSFNDQNEKERPLYTTKEEQRKPKQTCSTINLDKREPDIINEIVNKHSSFTHVTRVVAWILRALSRDQNKLPYLTIEEIRKAKIKIIKKIQQSEFSDDIESLKKQNIVDMKSQILNLNPFLDDNQILRVGGRIKHANINTNMKHPIIIPHAGHFTDLLIDHAHKMTFHGGARLTLSWLRQQYWLIGGNGAVKKRLRRCVTCRKHNPTISSQIMGDLPEARLNPTRPFYHTGVDYTGFVDVKANKGRGIKTTKGYIAVFVCMVTKAVHLELVSDLSSSAFLAALRRMAARRGAPQNIYSDNGTNFVGASRVLQREFINLKQTLDEEFFSAIADMEIQWHFICPRWPNSGGLWEGAVKSLKHHLVRVIGNQKLTFEEYSTLLAQLEACLNARPLCTISEDPDDINYLTPSHFLSSGPLLTIIETEKDERTRWRLTQKILEDIWKRWKAEYLCQLSIRSKWQRPKENIKLDDIVLIHDDVMSAGRWALGRVVELHPGKDGYVRVVSLKTKNGLMKRPIIKLSVLPTSCENYQNIAILKEQQSPEKSSSNQEGSRKSKRVRKPNPFLLMSSIIFLIMITGAQCAFNVTKLRDQQRILLDKVCNMELLSDDWKLVVYYDLDPYWQGTIAFERYTKQLQQSCQNIKNQSHCDVILMQLIQDFSELEYNNHLLLSQHSSARPGPRRRRGLINGVGFIANKLFGVLDESFAEQYQKDIELIRDNQQHLASLWKNQTSITESEYNLLKRVEDSMNRQQKIIHQHFFKVDKAINKLSNEVQILSDINDFTLGALTASSMLQCLRTIQSMLMDVVTDIYQGQFNFHILTPEQLRNELSLISSHISKDLSLPIKNIQTDLQSIYKLLKVKARMTKEYLLLEIRIPLVSRDTYEIFKATAIPEKKGRSMISVIPTAEYLAINLKKDAYMPMSGGEIKECYQDDETFFCHTRKPIYHIKQGENFCVTNKTLNHCEALSTLCTNMWQEMHKENQYLYFCCDKCQLRLICEIQEISAAQLTGAGIISISHGCIIKTDEFTIYSQKHDQNTIKTKTDIILPVISSINNLINVTIQSLPITDESKEINTQKQALQKIHEQIEQIKQKGALAEGISYHDVHHYTAIYGIAFTIVGVAISLCVWRRLRKRPRQQAADPRSAPAPAASAAAEAVRTVQPAAAHASISDCDERCASVRFIKRQGASVSARKRDANTSPMFGKTIFSINEGVV